MTPANPFRNEKVEAFITELRQVTLRMDRLIRELPTTDARVLGELHSLSVRIDRMVEEDPGRERSTMFLDQAKRQAMFTRQRYLHYAHTGNLRNA